MLSVLPAIPTALCLLVSTGLLLFWGRIVWLRLIHKLGLFLLACLSIWLLFAMSQHATLITYFGGWLPLYGISFLLDKLSAFLFILISACAIACGYYALGDIDEPQQKAGFYFAFWVLLMGSFGVVLTTDLFNLYVWFEALLIGAFMLLGLGKPKAWLGNKIKYVILNLLGTFFILMGVAFLYGLTGSLSIAGVAKWLSLHGDSFGLFLCGFSLLASGLFLKSGFFPMFSWLPAAYHTTSRTASALMGGVLTKVTVYMVLRLCLVFAFPSHPVIQYFLLVLAALTMLVGVLGAAAQFNYRRILSFHIVSQVGYMLMGVALFTPAAIVAALFFIAHNMITKTNLFLSAGIAESITGETDVRKMGGILQASPIVAWIFILSAFSLVGFPPLSGFWGKFALIKSAIVTGHGIMAAVAIIVSFLTLYSMNKILSYSYWQKPQSTLMPEKLNHFLLASSIFLLIIMLYLSFFPEPVFHWLRLGVAQNFAPQMYIQHVLGGGG